jgi:hypothetical protein
MDTNEFHTDVDAEFADSLVSTARTSLGDTLRSVVYFTPLDFDVLYTRQNLYGSPERARQVKSQLVDIEQVGFSEAPVRTAISRASGAPEIGAYEFTIRIHEDGFVVRIIEGEAGVILTTDDMDLDAFDTAALSIAGLLAER